MEKFMNLTRSSVDGSQPEKKGDLSRGRDQKTSMQKTQSHQEKKKGQNWFQRQFIRKMNRDDQSGDLEHVTAIAAAAYAASNQEISEIPQQKTGGSKRFSDGKGKKEPTSPAGDEKAMASVPSKKTLSFRELLKTKSDTTEPKVAAPAQSESSRPPTSAIPPTRDTEADAWEKAELEKIKQKYEKLKETIDSWENKKRKEAKRKLNMQESELEQRRLKAMDKFRDDVDRIDQIARGAREQADAKRRKEELKAREKANRIRTTGMPRGPCSCF
ncbi:remorin-like isoform X2 [Neltuma alba]|uniref:remorin-like isoform X2 n=1 Tax=Neltuma alba TaxID=207710 RepID=UPI0010A54C3C|nr:remorin-like isoform X2 [Prosopis alba]XP_028803653.1 remorin-like isoform X2 [Prosopis alba]